MYLIYRLYIYTDISKTHTRYSQYAGMFFFAAADGRCRICANHMRTRDDHEGKFGNNIVTVEIILQISICFVETLSSRAFLGGETAAGKMSS
jgi:hypothetical protein